MASMKKREARDWIDKLRSAHDAARTPGDHSYQVHMAHIEDQLWSDHSDEIIEALVAMRELVKFLERVERALAPLTKKE